MTALVDGRHVAKRWDQQSGLDPVDFVLAAGSFTCVKGRSGSGKSTLLALLADLARPDTGELRWSTELDEEARGRWTSVALVPQTLLLLPELSVIENVGLGATSDFDREHATTFEALGLSGLSARMIDTLSMGQRQRVAVARATVAHPRLLLADEPTSHQDRASAEMVLRALRAEAIRGTAVVVASHDAMVIAAADQVIDLDQ